MRGPSTTAKAFKRDFLRSFLLSLKSCRNGVTGMQDRRRAVRSAADAAMATARGGGAQWPQALLASSSSSSPPSSSCFSRLLPAAAANVKITRRKNLARRRCCHKRSTTSSGSSIEIARRLVRRRAKVLRGIVPGGELLDGVSLLREAMDYVVHLRAQVAVLRRVSHAMHHMPAGPVAPGVQLKGETARVSDGNEG